MIQSVAVVETEMKVPHTDEKPPSKILTVVFFKEESGSEPVRKWLKNFPKRVKKIIGEDIKTVQKGWPLGMPLVRNLGKGLWEIRSTIPME